MARLVPVPAGGSTIAFTVTFTITTTVNIVITITVTMTIGVQGGRGMARLVQVPADGSCFYKAVLVYCLLFVRPLVCWSACLLFGVCCLLFGV
jgi:hypothetical protein